MRTIVLKSGTNWYMLVRAQPVEQLALYQIRAGLVGPNSNQIGPDLVEGLGLVPNTKSSDDSTAGK
jgi:hypothetical protein